MLHTFIVSISLLVATASYAAKPSAAALSMDKALHEISGLVQTFYLNDADSLARWEKSVETMESILDKIHSPAAFTANMNRALNEIGLSPMAVSHIEDQNFWLSPPSQKRGEDQLTPYTIGAWFERRGRYWYVRELFPGSPAEKAGLIRGDKIEAMDGQDFGPILLAPAHAKHRKFKLTVQRDPTEAKLELEVGVEAVDYPTNFNRLLLERSRLMEVDGHRIGYVRLPGLRQELLAGFRHAFQRIQGDSQALIFDLRDGLPGRDSGFLGLFLSQEGEDGKAMKPEIELAQQPIFVLMNGETREGLEWLAYFLKERFGAQLVGENSAGQPLESEAVFLKSAPFVLRIHQADPSEWEGPSLGKALQVDKVIKAP